MRHRLSDPTLIELENHYILGEKTDIPEVDEPFDDRFAKVFNKPNFLSTRERPDFLQKADHIIHDQPH